MIFAGFGVSKSFVASKGMLGVLCIKASLKVNYLNYTALYKAEFYNQTKKFVIIQNYF